MGKRIFTKYLYGTVKRTAIGDLSSHYEQTIGIDRFVAEEDIEVIGFELMAQASIVPTDTDYGLQYWGCVAELSQVGAWASSQMSGVLAKALTEHIKEETDGAANVPALAQDHPEPHVVVMFPSGFSVPVKEEGTLYLNLSHWIDSDAGKEADLFGSCVIYYTHKRS